MITDENSIVDSEATQVFIMKGSKFEETIALSRCMPNERDEAFLVASGFFVLMEKYLTLEKLTFSTTEKGENKPVEFSGEQVTSELQNKRSNMALYSAFLLILFTKNLKMFYLNLDQMLILREDGKDSELSKMTVYDKIYG